MVKINYLNDSNIGDYLEKRLVLKQYLQANN